MQSLLNVWCVVLPFRVASRGVTVFWCQTVMSSVQGNTINTMATMSRLFGISRFRPESCHHLQRM